MPRNILNLSTQEKILSLFQDNIPTAEEKIVTFDGNAGTGAIGNVPVFTVTGKILVVRLVPVCTTNLAGATATIALGQTSLTSLFIAATTGTDIDTGEFWLDTSPAVGKALPAALMDIVVNENIVATVAVAAMSGGVLEFYLHWIPLSSDAAVEAA